MDQKDIIDNDLRTIKKIEFCKEPLKILGQFNLKNPFIIEPRTRLNKKEIDDIIYSFFDVIGSNFKNTYNKMTKEGNIHFSKKSNLSNDLFSYVKGQCCLFENQQIVIAKHWNDYEKIATLMHELTHMIEMLILKEKLTENELYSFYNLTLLDEVNARHCEQLYYNFLEEYGVDKRIVNTLRKEKIQELYYSLKKIDNDSKIVDLKVLKHFVDYNYELKNAYAHLLSTHFNNINNKEEYLSTTNNFKKSILSVPGIEIFDNINCTPKVLAKSIKSQINKCSNK